MRGGDSSARFREEWRTQVRSTRGLAAWPHPRTRHLPPPHFTTLDNGTGCHSHEKPIMFVADASMSPSMAGKLCVGRGGVREGMHDSGRQAECRHGWQAGALLGRMSSRTTGQEGARQQVPPTAPKSMPCSGGALLQTLQPLNSRQHHHGCAPGVGGEVGEEAGALPVHHARHQLLLVILHGRCPWLGRLGCRVCQFAVEEPGLRVWEGRAACFRV